MNRIVLDLEFTPINGPERKICREEIIQFGAVKIDENNNVSDSFETFVKPVHTTISKKVTKITHITDDMVADAILFEEAFTNFLDWIGEEEYSIFTWSDNDLRVIIQEIELEHFVDYRISYMVSHWVDAQHIVGELLGLQQQLSLKNVVLATDSQFDGQEHCALCDAANTARIVTLFDNKEELNRVLGPFIDMFTPTDDLTYSMGNLFSGIKLDN